MATATLHCLIARNPATGEEIGQVPSTAPEQVAEIVGRARIAQERWDQTGWKARRAALKRWWGILARDADRWADLIREEIGSDNKLMMDANQFWDVNQAIESISLTSDDWQVEFS